MRSSDLRQRPRGVGSRIFLSVAISFCALAFVPGCASTIGDRCTSNRDCATGQECDTAPPGGYCFEQMCRANSCPSEAWCATFAVSERTRTFCLRKCQADGDCRGGYKCRFELGTPGGVCYVAPTT